MKSGKGMVPLNQRLSYPTTSITMPLDFFHQEQYDVKKAAEIFPKPLSSHADIQMSEYVGMLK